MQRIAMATASLALLLLVAPQDASASVSLDWDGRAEMMNGFTTPDLMPNGASGDKVARNVGQGIKGGLYLGVGIPISIVGGLLTGVAIYFFVNADLLILENEDGAEGGALVLRIGGLIFLALGFSALGTGIGLIIKGAKALSKISDRSLTGPDTRMARAETNRARWGMQFSVAGVPIGR
jgi:hypothetical protein